MAQMAHQTTDSAELTEQLEAELMKQYGPMLTGSALVAALGYPSGDAFRQACARGTVPISVFPIERRRGKYALSRDVARWLAEQRLRQGASHLHKPELANQEVDYVEAPNRLNK